MTSYKNAKYGWLWTCYLFRLSQIADTTKPLVVEPTSAGLITVRARMFQGRQFLENTKQEDFAVFHKLSMQTKISVFENRVLHLFRKEEFEFELSLIAKNTWFDILRRINNFVLDITKSNLMLVGGFVLSGAQVSALVDYLHGYKVIKTAAVQTETIILRK